MKEYRVGKKGRPGCSLMEFSSDEECLNFLEKNDFIGHAGRKEPRSKKEWLRY